MSVWLRCRPPSRLSSTLCSSLWGALPAMWPKLSCFSQDWHTHPFTPAARSICSAPGTLLGPFGWTHLIQMDGAPQLSGRENEGPDPLLHHQPWKKRSRGRPGKWSQVWALKPRNLGLRPGGIASYQTSNSVQVIWPLGLQIPPLKKRSHHLDSSYGAAVRIHWEVIIHIWLLQAQVTTGNALPREIIEPLERIQLPAMTSISGYCVLIPSTIPVGPCNSLWGRAKPTWSHRGTGAAAGRVSMSVTNFSNVYPSSCYFISPRWGPLKRVTFRKLRLTSRWRSLLHRGYDFRGPRRNRTLESMHLLSWLKLFLFGGHMLPFHKEK